MIFWIFVLDSLSHSWSVPMKWQTSTCFVSRKTCKISSVSNTCSPHCIFVQCLTVHTHSSITDRSRRQTLSHLYRTAWQQHTHTVQSFTHLVQLQKQTITSTIYCKVKHVEPVGPQRSDLPDQHTEGPQRGDESSRSEGIRCKVRPFSSCHCENTDISTPRTKVNRNTSSKTKPQKTRWKLWTETRHLSVEMFTYLIISQPTRAIL